MPDDKDDAPRFTPDWLTCAYDVGRCTGRRMEGFEQCLAHLEANDLDAVLQRFTLSADLDLRGTTLTTRLLQRLLASVSFDPAGSSSSIGLADFRYCRFIVDDQQHDDAPPNDVLDESP